MTLPALRCAGLSLWDAVLFKEELEALSVSDVILAHLCTNKVAARRGLDMKEKERIVQMIGKLDEAHQSKIYEIIEKHQPTLLSGEFDIEVHKCRAHSGSLPKAAFL